LAYGETFHPVVGPVAEAEALYVRQLRLRERVLSEPGEFIIWDVGLGAAANPLTVIRTTRDVPCRLRFVSFDQTLEPLRFALSNPQALGYLGEYQGPLEKLLMHRQVACRHRSQQVEWEFHEGDFPSLVAHSTASRWPKPHAIMFDAFSPA